MPQPPFNPWKFAGVGIELVGVVGVMMFAGWSFDQWRGTTPWGMVVGAVVGIVGGLYNLVKDAMKSNR